MIMMMRIYSVYLKVWGMLHDSAALDAYYLFMISRDASFGYIVCFYLAGQQSH